ncbi:MAG: hypothetical protein J0M18_19265, partial [Ignavibacteria bacterium]|nr:hypothetical protein [Ignavibacteria bacterium]
ANSKLKEELGTFLDLTFGITKDLWYNFDSLPCFSSVDSVQMKWTDLRDLIESKTSEMNRIGGTYLQKLQSDPHSHTAHFEDYLSDLKTKANFIAS